MGVLTDIGPATVSVKSCASWLLLESVAYIVRFSVPVNPVAGVSFTVAVSPVPGVTVTVTLVGAVMVEGWPNGPALVTWKVGTTPLLESLPVTVKLTGVFIFVVTLLTGLSTNGCSDVAVVTGAASTVNVCCCDVLSVPVPVTVIVALPGNSRRA